MGVQHMRGLHAGGNAKSLQNYKALSMYFHTIDLENTSYTKQTRNSKTL